MIHCPSLDDSRLWKKGLLLEIHPTLSDELVAASQLSGLDPAQLLVEALRWGATDLVNQEKIRSKKCNKWIFMFRALVSRKFQKPARVFICHAKEDRKRAKAIFRELEKRGVNPWLDKERLIGGQDWETEIQRVISESDAIVVLLSRNSVEKRGFVQVEIRYALRIAQMIPEGRGFIIPVRIDGVELPPSLRKWQAIDLVGRASYKRLLLSIQWAAFSRVKNED